MLIEIEPFDTLFFRDGKPFSLGEETWADGIFPPFPSVIYGALRTAFFAHTNQSIVLANEPGDVSQNLEIKRLSMTVNGKEIYPLPLDLVQKRNRPAREKRAEKKRKKHTVVLLEKIKNRYISSAPKIEYLLSYSEPVENLNNGYFTRTDLEQYLGLFESQFQAMDLKDYIVIEPKIGIARDNLAHSIQEGKLYRVEMQRLKDVKLVVEFSGLEGLWSEGFLKLGGEGKVVTYRTEDYPRVKMPKITSPRFKLYLSTPGLLKHGWLPEWIDPTILEGTYPGTNLRVKLIAAAVGRPLHIGGFDIKERKPKQMLKAVPAGSVYYFEILCNVNYTDTLSILPVQFCDYKDRQKEGFGITYLGRVA